MRSFRALMVGAAIAALTFGAGALAQVTGLFPTSFLGTETLELSVGGPGGTSEYATVSMLRNTNAITVVTGSGSATTAMTTNQSLLMWHSTAPTTWTITLPASPFDGQVAQIGTDTTLTSLVTVQAASGQSLSATYNSQTLTAKTSVEFQYAASTTTWYQMR